jgi:hypothetical protein
VTEVIGSGVEVGDRGWSSCLCSGSRSWFSGVLVCVVGAGVGSSVGSSVGAVSVVGSGVGSSVGAK